MEKLTNMINMAKAEGESYPIPAEQMKQPAYPYGLCLSLCEEEIQKLGLGDGETSVGDIIHMHAIASVTSVSKHDNINSGPSSRIELQITHMSALESEDQENAEAEKKMTAKDKITKLYNSKG